MGRILLAHVNARSWQPDSFTLKGLSLRPANPLGGLVALLFGLAIFGAAAPGHAQSTSIVIPNAGEVSTTSKVDNGILAVTNQIIRNPRGVRECVGACFYAARTATKTWICRQSDCSLDCSGREPVGGC
jgi:hypothetical protein